MGCDGLLGCLGDGKVHQGKVSPDDLSWGKKKVSLCFLLHAHSPACVRRIARRSLANQQHISTARVRPQRSTSTFKGNIQTANFQIFLKTSHGAGASDIFEHTNTYLCDTCNAVLKPCCHTHTHSLGTSAISAHTSDTSISPTHASRAKVGFWGG